jgi:hypothetical protein
VNGVVEWQGPVAPRELIPVQVLLQIPAGAAYGESYGTTLTVDDVDWGETFTLDATFTVMRTFLLPLIFGAEAPYQLYLPLIAAQ